MARWAQRRHIVCGNPCRSGRKASGAPASVPPNDNLYAQLPAYPYPEPERCPAPATPGPVRNGRKRGSTFPVAPKSGRYGLPESFQRSICPQPLPLRSRATRARPAGDCFPDRAHRTTGRCIRSARGRRCCRWHVPQGFPEGRNISNKGLRLRPDFRPANRLSRPRLRRGSARSFFNRFLGELRPQA